MNKEKFISNFVFQMEVKNRYKKDHYDPYQPLSEINQPRHIRYSKIAEEEFNKNKAK